jgi:protein O-mannosyl-transferase
MRGGSRGASSRSASGVVGPLLLVLAVALATFIRALGNGFVWDDKVILSKQLSAFPTLAQVFFPPANIPQYSPFYYRPMVVLTYLVDGTLGGGSPLPFHATPILLHALAACLALLLFLRLLGPNATAAATVGALAFAVHPAHTEVAAWMAGRGDAIATVGVLVALLAWGRWLETPGWGWLAAGAGGLLFGLLGKEAAIVGAPLAAALPWIWPRQRRRHAAKPLLLWGAIAAAVVLYVVLRASGPGFAPGVAPASAAGAVDVLGTLGVYAESVLWPATAGVVLTAAPSDTFHVLLGLVALGLWTGGVVWAAWRFSVLSLWALSWLALGLVPPLLLVVRSLSETPVADRYLYLPSVALALLAALAFARLPKRGERPGLCAAAVVLAVWAVLGAKHAAIWHDDMRFWTNAVEAAPDEGFARMKLATTLYRANEIDASEAAFRTALASRLSKPQRAVAENNLGWLFLKLGRRDEAEQLFRSSLAAGPAFAGPYRGLAECLWPRGEDAAVRAQIKTLLGQAALYDRHDARVAFLLANVHLVEGNRDQAAHWFEEAIRANPRATSAARARAALANLRGS